MKNVSSAFREELKKDNRNYIKSADITLKSGTVLKIDNSDLWQNGMKLDTATSSANSFDLGAIITGQLTLTLNNIDEKFSDYDFTDCTATNVKVGLKLPDGTTESLSYGKFYLNEAKYNGSIITLTFYDSIYKFDQPYSKSSLSYPATLGQILRDACSVCDVPMGTVEFDNDDYVVQSRPNDKSLTFRQVLKWIGEISVHYFFADEEGRLSVGWYDLESQNNQIEETILQDTDGENILDTNNDEIITSIESGIRHFVSLSVGMDDVVITGVRVLHDVEGDSGTETITYQAGSDGYLIEISKNKLIQGDEGTNVANMVAAKLVGLRFRAYQATGLSDPTREVGDTVWLIDRKNNRYKSVITNNTFQPGNFQNFSCGAVSPARNSATRYSQITQVYVDYRKDIEKERTDREKALDELTERIDGSSGLFTTEEIQEDGSTIFYLHNKPMLSESDIIWKMTAEAWGVSTDGGKTYNAGMTVDGDTIVRILTAVGVNADWIKTGAISVEDTDGNETFYVDTETGQVRIVANSFTLKGQSIEDIAENQVNDFVDAVYTPTIDNIQKQIDGQIETYYYDYEPTLSNVPAIDWTSEDERKSHEGDLFYWKSRGYAYRFFKDGDTWKWQLVQDTDITKALQQAADAQDTADQKRRVFVRQPTPPYDVGDLWVGNNTSDLMRCQRARSSGSYNADDWIKAVKYTDDTELNNFIREDYSETIQEILNSVDKKAQTWYQTTDPSLDWASIEESVLQDTDGNSILDSENNDIITLWEKEKSTHDGDLWRNPANNTEYMYVDGNWVEMSIPDEVFDTIDGKAQIFVSTPTPPYAIGDLWFNSATSDIMTCINGRDSGSYTASDWEKRNKYTDDSYANEVNENLSAFADSVADDMVSLQTQIDGKIETYYYDYEPTLQNYPASEWTTNKEKQKHIGDLFYWEEKGFTYRFQQNGASYLWQAIQDSDINTALANAAAAQDTADGKRRVFVATPVPPYDEGDLWSQGSDGDIMVCKTPRASGSYVSSDWVKASKYTDDSAVEDLDHSLDKQGVFDRLTNYGEVKGIFLESDGQLYINASYLMTGILKVAQPGASGKETFYANMDTGEVRIVANSFSLTSGDTIDSIAQSAVDDFDDSLTQTDIFNRLTGNKANEAIILQNGHIYINASYLNTGILQVSTASGTETLYVNVDTGEVRINATSFSLTDGRTIDSIADNAKSEAIQYTDERLSDYDPADDLTQQEVFNILTNGGITQGIYLNGGRVYVNASYIGAGTLDADRIDAKGLTVYNTSGTRTLYIDNNGNVSINANSLMLSGSSVNSIANNAANNALQDAKDYTDLQIENFDPDLTQQEVFNILTNGGTTQGIYLSGGKIYINATYIGSGTISASRIAAGSITASKLSISDLYAIGATIGGFVLGSQGMRSSDSSIRLWSDGRIQIGACVLSANSNAFQVRYGLHIYCDPSVFSDGSGYFKIFNLAHVTSGGHLVFNSDGATVAYLSSSSKRYKNHISDVPDEEALRILDIPVIKFKYKDGYLFPTDFLVDKEIPGFYAEDVEEVNPILCQYNEDGSVEDWNYRTMIPYMVKTMQIQQKRIDDLQTQIEELKTMILNMKGA